MPTAFIKFMAQPAFAKRLRSSINLVHVEPLLAAVSVGRMRGYRKGISLKGRRSVPPRAHCSANEPLFCDYCGVGLSCHPVSSYRQVISSGHSCSKPCAQREMADARVGALHVFFHLMRGDTNCFSLSNFKCSSGRRAPPLYCSQVRVLIALPGVFFGSTSSDVVILVASSRAPFAAYASATLS